MNCGGAEEYVASGGVAVGPDFGSEAHVWIDGCGGFWVGFFAKS